MRNLVAWEHRSSESMGPSSSPGTHLVSLISQGIGAYLPVFQLAQLVAGQGRVVRTREEIRGP